MLNGPFSPWPAFDREEVDAVAAVIASGRVNYWTGSESREFEKEYAAWSGSAHAIALANGTLALDVALKALGIGRGDEVVVTPRTFIASVSCVVNAGASPVFADIDRNSGNISAATIARAITKRTRAVIPVHLAGWPCDMDAIMSLAKQQKLFVIEDCAQAHGAMHRGRHVGTFGDVGAWSFCQDKIITTGGEGGMVTTDNRDLWSRMWSFKDHGKSFDAVHAPVTKPGFRWLHESFGTNWRMLEVQAAIGRIQLRRLAGWTAKRNANADVIRRALQPFAGVEGSIRVPEFGCADCAGGRKKEPCCVHGQYKFYVYVRPEMLAKGWSRDRIVSEINAAGVPCYTGSCSEVYRERAFDGTPWRPARPLAVAAELGETSVMFLVHPTLTTAELEKSAAVIEDVMSRATPKVLSA